MAQPQSTKRPSDQPDQPGTEEQAPWLRTVGVDGGAGAAEAGAAAAQAAAASAETVADALRTTVERGEEAVAFGLRAAAGWQEPLAEAGFSQTRRLTEATVRVTEVYREATERAAGDVQAILASYSSLRHGLQQWQHTWLDLLRQSFGQAEGRRHDLVGAGSIVAFAEWQRDAYLEAVNRVVDANTRLLQLAGQIAQDASRPLQERARQAAGA